MRAHKCVTEATAGRTTLSGIPGAPWLLVKLVTFCGQIFLPKDFPCAGAIIFHNDYPYCSYIFALKMFPLLITPTGNRCDYHPARPTGNRTRDTGNGTRHPHLSDRSELKQSPTGDLLLQLFKCYSWDWDPSSTKAIRVKYSWLKLIRAHFISPFQKRNKQQQQQH